MLFRSEAITLSQYLETADGKYRPSVYYVYQPTDATLAGIHELRGRELDKQMKERIIKDEIIAGMDELGVLLITNKGKVYWHGSQLDINEARKLIPGENATSLQVVANILGTMMWAIYNPRKGYTEPEDMDWKFILEQAMPYLGPVPFKESDWRPEEDKNDLMNQNYSFLEERDYNKMPEYTRHDAPSISGGSSQSAHQAAMNRKTGGATENAYEAMMKARGAEMQQRAPPATPNFSSPY